MFNYRYVLPGLCFTAVVAIGAAISFLPLATAAIGGDVEARVLRVVDGDTLVVSVHVRLIDVDAPETLPQFACGGDGELELGEEAKARVAELVNGRAVLLTDIGGPDPFGRLLANVEIDGTDLGRWLFGQHLARIYPDGEEFWCP